MKSNDWKPTEKVLESEADKGRYHFLMATHLVSSIIIDTDNE